MLKFTKSFGLFDMQTLPETSIQQRIISAFMPVSAHLQASRNQFFQILLETSVDQISLEERHSYAGFTVASLYLTVSNQSCFVGSSCLSPTSYDEARSTLINLIGKEPEFVPLTQ